MGPKRTATIVLARRPQPIGRTDQRDRRRQSRCFRAETGTPLGLKPATLRRPHQRALQRRSAAPSTATTAPTPAKRELPGPVLAPAPQRVVPNKAAVANKIRTVKVKGMTGSYSGAVVEVGSGKVVYAHNCHPGLHPGLDNEVAHLDGRIVDLGTRAHLQDVGGQSEAGSDHSGRRRRSVPCQQVTRRLSEAGDDHRTGAGHGKSPEARQDQEGQPGLRRVAVPRPVVEPTLAGFLR